MEETSLALLKEGQKICENTTPATTFVPTEGPWIAPPLAPYLPPANAAASLALSVRLDSPSERISVPNARWLGDVVGRDGDIREITAKLTVGTSSRLVLWGPAGMGKDTAAAEVVLGREGREGVVAQMQATSETSGVSVLPMWVQASSEIVLQRQLIDFFTVHRPKVLLGAGNIPDKIAKIKLWLQTTSEKWLIVFEDASANSTTVWDILCQPEMKNKGRVLITSQAPLHLDKMKEFCFDGHELEEIETVDSLNFLLKENLFRKKPGNETVQVLDDATLKAKCEDIGVDYAEPPPREKAKDSLQRRKELTRGLIEFSRPEVAIFLKRELGNLPLSLSMVAQLIRSEPGITSTLDLIAMFKNVELNEVWVKKARDKIKDRHYFGLAASVQIALNRMDSNEEFTVTERREAKALLCALSRLDRTKVPMSLLTGHEMKDLVNRECPEGKFVLQQLACAADCPDHPSF
jgi:hypothetical protein